MNACTLAYRYVAIALMIAHVNYIAPKLGIANITPVRETDIKSLYLPDPFLRGPQGVLSLERYWFSFSGKAPIGAKDIMTGAGRLRYITFINNTGGFSFNDYVDQWSKREITVNTNDVYKSAVTWLEALGVDVKGVESDSPHEVQQALQLGYPVPIFRANWGRPNDLKITILVGGHGELLTLRVENLSYLKSAPPWKTNIVDLMKISDAEFLKYNSEMRSNLVLRYASDAIRFDMSREAGTNSYRTNVSSNSNAGRVQSK